jgi:hypothetical protein
LDEARSPKRRGAWTRRSAYQPWRVAALGGAAWEARHMVELRGTGGASAMFRRSSVAKRMEQHRPCSGGAASAMFISIWGSTSSWYIARRLQGDVGVKLERPAEVDETMAGCYGTAAEECAEVNGEGWIVEESGWGTTSVYRCHWCWRVQSR